MYCRWHRETGEIMPAYVSLRHDRTDLLYSRALDRGQRATFWAALTGRSRCLLALEEVWQESRLASIEQPHFVAETRLVPLDQILGSDGRCGDFDREFNPLHDHGRGRWLRIAAARRRGTALPPVDLVQVGNLYFVQDGHHRISVARALGQPDIEARVTVWHVSGPLPWETQAGPSKQGPSGGSGPEMVVKRLYHEILTYVRTLRPDRREGHVTGGSLA